MNLECDIEQDCPPAGCWWERVDTTRRVLSFLPTNKDVLACDLVCREWAALKVCHTLTCPWQFMQRPDAVVQLGFCHQLQLVRSSLH